MFGFHDVELVHYRVTPLRWPPIRFLFVGAEFCFTLPSDSASQRTPLLRLAVPVITARRGLAPPRFTTCLAHKSKPPLKSGWLLLLLRSQWTRSIMRLVYAKNGGDIWGNNKRVRGAYCPIGIIGIACWQVGEVTAKGYPCDDKQSGV